MQEIELKCQIPTASLAAVQAHIAGLPGGDAPPQHLQAAYFDTPDRRLARARAALRVRQEDTDWVQTLKAAGANALTRLEDNQPAVPAPPGASIRPDLSLHHAQEVRQALVRDLGWQPDADPLGQQVGLVQLYRTDMRRSRARVAVAEGADGRGVRDQGQGQVQGEIQGEVELALDQGLIAAGERQLAVHELEIELLNGSPLCVIRMARELVTQHGLWLDTQTKAHRGDQLAREAASGQASPLPPQRPRTRIRPEATPAQAWAAALDAALEQVCGNASDIAQPGRFTSTKPHGLAPWVRGWATGVRRLAWVWRHAPVSETRTASRSVIRDAAHHQAVQDRLRSVYARLRPAPMAWLPDDEAVRLARSPAVTQLWLDVLETIVEAG